MLRRRAAQSAVVLAATLGSLFAANAPAAEVIDVELDQATIMRLPERVATLVIGNPLIADATIQPGGLMVLTGKGYGSTNLVALDRDGAVLMSRSILVTGAKDHVVVVYRGVARESYSCAPDCERRVTLGDSPEYFDASLNQSGTRSSRAGGSGNGGQSPPR
jgi:Flp pilus assembly secretin CpaC